MFIFVPVRILENLAQTNRLFNHWTAIRSFALPNGEGCFVFMATFAVLNFYARLGILMCKTLFSFTDFCRLMAVSQCVGIAAVLSVCLSLCLYVCLFVCLANCCETAPARTEIHQPIYRATLRCALRTDPSKLAQNPRVRHGGRVRH
jgi:hypothetical protein